MRGNHLYVIACLFAMLTPFVKLESSRGASEARFSGWPAHHDGIILEPVPLTEREIRFQSGFPGKIAKFTDGRRTIIMRWVVEETRKLHPASECFKGIGYGVRPLPIRADPHGVLWGSFLAVRGKERVRVSERIFDESGNCWTDVSAWYWAALLEKTRRPWWAITVVEDASRLGEDQALAGQVSLAMSTTSPF
jgi:hypothetical protein